MAHEDPRKIHGKELLSMLVTAIGIGFILSFRSWGTTAVDVVMGLTTLITLTAASLAFILIRVWTQKWIALRLGYLTRYTIHKYTFPASLLLVLFTNGLVPYISTGELRIRESKRLRLGAFRYGLNYGDLAVIGIAAPVSMILLMIIIKPIYLATNNPLISRIVWAAAIITFVGMLPIKGQEGLDILYHRRWLYVICLTFIVIYFLLILTTSIFSYVIAAVIALSASYIYREYIN